MPGWSSLKSATAIIDKGFYSKKNIEMLEGAGMKFIVPLKRSDKSIDCVPVMAGGISGMEGHFSFEGRNIWYYTRDVDGRKMYVYLDTRLREKESDDFLKRVERNAEKKEADRVLTVTASAAFSVRSSAAF